LPVVSVPRAILSAAMVAAIDAVSPAFVKVAEPVTSPVNSTVTAEVNALAVAAVPDVFAEIPSFNATVGVAVSPELFVRTIS